tara:strand:+ start:1087 stop:1188 length:102 start_codon:yes stop_codon:yes gene_type:complete
MRLFLFALEMSLVEGWDKAMHTERLGTLAKKVL